MLSYTIMIKFKATVSLFNYSHSSLKLTLSKQDFIEETNLATEHNV